MSLATGLTALGSTQATALPLGAKFNHFGTVGASTGARLPSDSPLNAEIFVKNGSGTTLNIYPPVGYSIDGGTVNAAVTLSGATTVRFIAKGDGNWYSMY